MRYCAVACPLSFGMARQVPCEGCACAILGHHKGRSRRLMLSLLREKQFCRNHQMQVFYQVVDFFRPSWVLMENVQDIMTKVGSSHQVALKSVSLVCASHSRPSLKEVCQGKMYDVAMACDCAGGWCVPQAGSGAPADGQLPDPCGHTASMQLWNSTGTEQVGLALCCRVTGSQG